MNKKQEVYDKMGRELVNHLPGYRDTIIESVIKEAETSGIIMVNPAKKRVKPTPTIDMFPEISSSRKEDLK